MPPSESIGFAPHGAEDLEPGTFHPGPWTRLALLGLGLAAVVMLYATHRIGDRHVAHYAPIERAAADLRVSLSLSHLWLEEYLTGDSQVDLEADVHHQMDRADTLATALLDGGAVGDGRSISKPLREDDLRRRARNILFGLETFRTLARSRLQSTSGIGSHLDERYDHAFRELLAEAGNLERGIEDRMLVGRRRSNLLFGAILVAWLLLTGVTLVTLSRREKRQLATEAALARSREQLRQAQKLEAVGRLAGGLAHDVNNYLATINSQAGLVKLLHDDRPGVGSMMDEITATVGRTTSLIQRLLAFSRSQPTQPRVVDVNRVTEDLSGMVRRLLDDRVRLSIRPGADLWPVEVDPAQLEQVLVNLLVNAGEAMPAGGRVTVTTSNVRRREAGPAAGAVGDYVCLAVRDEGTGIAPEVRDKIFEPFFTTKDGETAREGDHSGLGLATVYGIVRQAGGFVEVESEPGEGTAFRVFLPRTEKTPEEAAEEAAVETGPAGRGDGRRVLLVEDNRELRRATTAVLAALGHRVTTAADGDEGLRHLRADPPYDVVVTDLVMPGVSGREVAEAVLAGEGTGLVMTSGFRDRVRTDDLLASPRVRYLDKPYRPIDLLRAMVEIGGVVEGAGTERHAAAGAAEAARPH